MYRSRTGYDSAPNVVASAKEACSRIAARCIKRDDCWERGECGERACSPARRKITSGFTLVQKALEEARGRKRLYQDPLRAQSTSGRVDDYRRNFISRTNDTFVTCVPVPSRRHAVVTRWRDYRAIPILIERAMHHRPPRTFFIALGQRRGENRGNGR